MERFLQGNVPLRLWQVNSEENICICYSSHLGLIHQCLSRAPAKWRNTVYVLTEIYHQRSKWLGPKSRLIAAGFFHLTLQIIQNFPNWVQNCFSPMVVGSQKFVLHCNLHNGQKMSKYACSNQAKSLVLSYNHIKKSLSTDILTWKLDLRI